MRGPLAPDGIRRCLLSSQKGWDAKIGLATSVVNKLNRIRREEERREEERKGDETIGSRRIKRQAM